MNVHGLLADYLMWEAGLGFLNDNSLLFSPNDSLVVYSHLFGSCLGRRSHPGKMPLQLFGSDTI